jgi:voltage-gated potassium channel
MIGGICLIGAAGATITHWIISQVAKDEVAQQSVTVAHIDELRDEIARLRHLLEKTTGEANGEAPPRISTTPGSQRN